MAARELLVLLGLVAVVAGQSCTPPFEAVAGKCVYVEYSGGQSEGVTWQEARDFCKEQGGSQFNVDLASFPTCDQYTEFTRYLAFNAPTNSTFWLGAHSLFSANMWQWVTLEALQTGVPFWYYGEGFHDNNACAAADGSHYYKMTTGNCDELKGFACSYTPTLTVKVLDDPEPKDCPDGSIVVGNFCYVFHDHDESFERAEERCRDEHHTHGGELFYPTSCEEFTYMAHHLEATEDTREYWAGGIDISGEDEWTWVNGGLLPGGPPFWASGEPSHEHEDAPRKHCSTMNPDYRFYLRDRLCSSKHHYICKLTLI